MTLRFDNKVAIVTGAGNGLGKAYALLLGSRGAKVVVNDLGGSRSGDGADSRPADNVVSEIQSTGGTAVASYDSVEDGAAIVRTAIDSYGRVDIVINNAGILRDKSFSRMSDEDWNLVHRVHLYGAFQVTRAAFPYMKEQKYGRIIMTSSTSGIYGNFGQANYSAAKLGLHGLSQTLAKEGQRYNVHCNTVSPVGGTRLTEDIFPPELFAGLKPELIAPLVVWLCHEECPESGGLFEAAGGWFSKYRIERTQGVVCRGSLSELVSPERVRDRWAAITSFEGSKHPASVEESSGMVAQMLQDMAEKDKRRAAGTLQTGPLAAVGFREDPVAFTYTARDVILYALGVGVSTRDANHLQFLYEGDTDFCTLPTFAIIAAQAAMMGSSLMTGGVEGWTPDYSKVLHGEQYLELHAPLPPTGATLYSSLEVLDVMDKQSGAVVVVAVSTTDEAGILVATTQFLLFVAGEGGFGGHRSSEVVVPLVETPQRPPDVAVPHTTSVDQAALYRLSGDFNPLHIDPSFAAMGGFQRPILHGLCSLGVACRAVVASYCGGDPARVRGIKARFSKPVIPGQTIITEMWLQGARVLFRCIVQETKETCLTGGYVDLVSAPTSTLKPGLEAPPPSKASSVFEELARRVSAQGPELVRKVNGVFLWNITSGDKQAMQWTVDLKTLPGAVYPGPPTNSRSPDVTMTLADDDLLALVAGTLNPQKAFMTGKLKLAGNIMLSQKLKELFDANKSKL